MKYDFSLIVLTLCPLLVFVKRLLSLPNDLFRRFQTNSRYFNPKHYTIPNDFICKVYGLKRKSVPKYFYGLLWYFVLHVLVGSVMVFVYTVFYFIGYESVLVCGVFSLTLSLCLIIAILIFSAFWVADYIGEKIREKHKRED